MVCVCVCVRACVRACVRVYVCVCVRVCAVCRELYFKAGIVDKEKGAAYGAFYEGVNETG